MGPIARAAAASPASDAAAPPALAPAPLLAEPLDVTAESVPDTAATLADDLSRRVAALMVAQHDQDAGRQVRLDRLRAEFDADQAERAEYQREMNVLRDMAVEQQKRDDEFLKKMIALI